MRNGRNTYNDQMGAARDFARSQRERNPARSRVRDPEVNMLVITTRAGDGSCSYRLQHRSNHPGDQLLEHQADDFDTLMEVIQDVLQEDLDEEL
jgi:hypothetical protein